MNSIKNSALLEKEHSRHHITKSSLRILILLCVLALSLAILSSFSILRNKIKNLFTHPHQTEILSKIFMNYDGHSFVAFKIKTSDGIELNIYEKDLKTSNQTLKNKFNFQDDRDAYLIVEGNTVNLALSDIDSDDTKEIIMPTVDQFGISRLNIFKYNTELKQFTQSIATE